jgi:hypothetical protein
VRVSIDGTVYLRCSCVSEAALRKRPVQAIALRFFCCCRSTCRIWESAVESVAWTCRGFDLTLQKAHGLDGWG